VSYVFATPAVTVTDMTSRSARTAVTVAFAVALTACGDLTTAPVADTSISQRPAAALTATSDSIAAGLAAASSSVADLDAALTALIDEVVALRPEPAPDVTAVTESSPQRAGDLTEALGGAAAAIGDAFAQAFDSPAADATADFFRDEFVRRTGRTPAEALAEVAGMSKSALADAARAGSARAASSGLDPARAARVADTLTDLAVLLDGPDADVTAALEGFAAADIAAAAAAIRAQISPLGEFVDELRQMTAPLASQLATGLDTHLASVTALLDWVAVNTDPVTSVAALSVALDRLEQVRVDAAGYLLA
jgi:hypothetical protein